MFFTRWFWDRFEKSGSLVVAVLVPINKLKFKNVVRYDNYCGFLKVIASERLVFVDKKSVKGCKLYNKKGWSDPLTGEQPVDIFHPIFVIHIV